MFVSETIHKKTGLFVSQCLPEQRHHRVWEDLKNKSQQHHGRSVHQRAHRGWAETSCFAGNRFHSAGNWLCRVVFQNCWETSEPRFWSNSSNHTQESTSPSFLRSVHVLTPLLNTFKYLVTFKELNGRLSHENSSLKTHRKRNNDGFMFHFPQSCGL